jgi:type I restriction enzyme, S subunit
MSLPAYDEYKDSGIDWLGQLPAHWDVIKGGWIGSLFGSESVPEELVSDEGNLPFIKVGSLSKDSFEIASWDWFVHPSVEDEYRTRRGYVVFPKRGAAIFLNKVNVVDKPSLIDPNLMGWEINGKADSVFIAYVLKTRKLDELADVSTVPQINNKHISPERFPIPPLDEQKAISSFLDVETSKIDGLVSEQRRLIELLKEKRQAVISHAVTKGLNPNAPMKPSGIQWLGDVPQHWEVKAFQRCVSVAEGQVDPKQTEFSEMVLIAPNHIQSGTGQLLDLENADEQGAISGKYFCKAGNVIYSKIRPALRKVCIAPEDCLCSADMYPLHAHSGLTNEFLFRWILTEQFSAFAVLESDRVAMPKINRESLKQVKFALPPIDEQRQICEHIASQTIGFDRLVAEAERAIELLQERRTALISAAVTGKIDVRGVLETAAS